MEVKSGRKRAGDWTEERALQEVLGGEAVDIPEDEESDSGDEEIEESQNGKKTAWLPSHAHQLGNDDEDWEKEAAEYWERISIFEDFVDR